MVALYQFLFLIQYIFSVMKIIGKYRMTELKKLRFCYCILTVRHETL